MGETTGYPKLSAILFIKFNLDMPTVGRTAHSHVNRNVKHRSAQHGHKLSLRPRVLEMEAAQNASPGPRKIILHEGTYDAGRGVTVTLKQFHEEPTAVTLNFRLYHQNIGNVRFYHLHLRSPIAPSALTEGRNPGS